MVYLCLYEKVFSLFPYYIAKANPQKTLDQKILKSKIERLFLERSTRFQGWRWITVHIKFDLGISQELKITFW